MQSVDTRVLLQMSAFFKLVDVNINTGAPLVSLQLIGYLINMFTTNKNTKYFSRSDHEIFMTK